MLRWFLFTRHPELDNRSAWDRLPMEQQAEILRHNLMRGFW